MNTEIVPINFSARNREHVYLLQKGLVALGYLGDETWIYDPKTEEAFRQFQADYGLTVTKYPRLESINLLNVELSKLYRITGKITGQFGRPIEGLSLKFRITAPSTIHDEIGETVTLSDGSYLLFPNFNKELLDDEGILKCNLRVCVIIEQIQIKPPAKTDACFNISGIETVFNYHYEEFQYTGITLYRDMEKRLDCQGYKLTGLFKSDFKEILTCSRDTDIDMETLLRMILASYANMIISANYDLTMSCFALLYRNYPPNMPPTYYDPQMDTWGGSEWNKYLDELFKLFKGGMMLATEEVLIEHLTAAVEANIIYLSADDIRTHAEELVKYFRKSLGDFPLLEGDSNGNLIIEIVKLAEGLANVTINNKEKFVDYFINYIDDFNGFISFLNSNEIREQYGDAFINALIFVFELARITRNFLPLMDRIVKDGGIMGKIKDGNNRYKTQYLATLPLPEWVSMVNGLNPPKVPNDFQAMPRPVDDYATFVYRNLQMLYPGTSVFLEIGTPKARNVGDILFKYPDFDLLEDQIDKRPEIVNELEGAGVLDEFNDIQRVFRITPSPEVAATLLNHGITSAAQLYFMGKNQFETIMRYSLSQKDIDLTFALASGRTASALSAYTSLNTVFQKVTPKALGGFNKDFIIYLEDQLKSDFPDIRTLFGDLEYCECPHDNSVYSAPAYLADMLTCLNQLYSGGTQVKKFFDYHNTNSNMLRRHDISKIYLNEQNTNTIMPYIDLVCEVLEEGVLRTVVPPNFVRHPDTCQSTLSTRELLAAPEHILSHGGITAYDILCDKIYPMYAALNLYETEARVYLKHIGIDRYRLMEFLTQKPIPIEMGAITITSNEDMCAIAAEYFTLTSWEEKWVIGEGGSYNDRNAVWREINSGSSTPNAVMDIKDFLKDSDLSTHEFLDILKAKWIDIKSNYKENCSLDGVVVSGTKVQFDRAHRFIRLYQHADWKIWELNMLLESVLSPEGTPYYDSLNCKTLSNFHLFSQQQNYLRLSAEELLAFYQNINTVPPPFINGRTGTSLYDHIFLNTALANPVNSKLETIKNGGTVSLLEEDEIFIASCLAILNSDYELLKEFYNSTPLNADLKYLSFLYRNKTMALKCKLSIGEWLRYLALIKRTSANPFTVEEINKIYVSIQELKVSKIPLAEYEYIADYYYSATPPALPEAARLALSTGEEGEIEALRLTLREVVEGFEDMLPPRSEDQMHPLPEEEEDTSNAIFATEKYKDEFRAFVNSIGIYTENNIDIEDIIRVVESTKIWVWDEETETEIEVLIPQERIKALFPPLLGCRIDLSALPYPYDITDKEALITRYRVVLDYYNTLALRIVIRDIISVFYDVSPVISDTFLTGVTYNEMPLIELLTNEDNYNSTYDVYNDTISAIIILMHKIVKTVKINNISPYNFILLLDIQDKIKFHWNKFSIYSIDDIDFSKLQELQRMLGLQKLYGQDEDGETLFSIINDNEMLPDFETALCDLTGWALTDLEVLRRESDIAIYYQSVNYLLFNSCFEIQSITRAPMEWLENWSKRPLNKNASKAIADAIKKCVKSKYPIDQWLDDLPAIQKPIREAKSNALGSYLIQYSLRYTASPIPLCKDKTALYNYYLLDTEMSSCMKTSRIVQATCSVQLFVQRCLLNLEQGVITNDTWKQWEWMKKYRVWEANRKIFLYPENWIEPELRDDKSPFFKELEDDLTQSEMSDELAEKAFENYLVKLDEVSNLLVCGLYRETADNNDGFQETIPKLETIVEKGGSRMDILHVIARSRTIPYNYYYRIYDAIAQQWNYWEKVDTDINGDVVVPYVYNRRLHLFCISVTKKNYNNNNKGTTQANVMEGDLYNEIQLGWTYFKDGKWTKIQYSKKRLFNYGHYPQINYSLFAKMGENNELILSVYCQNNAFNENSAKIVGYFLFNGDVNNALNVINVFPLPNLNENQNQNSNQNSDSTLNSITPQVDTQNTLLRKLGITGAVICNDVYNSAVAKSYGERYQMYAKLTQNNDLEELPIPALILNWANVPNIVRDNFYSNRNYPIGESEKRNGRKEIALPNSNSSTKILSTFNPMANIAQMLHDYVDDRSAISGSHTFFPSFYQDDERVFMLSPRRTSETPSKDGANVLDRVALFYRLSACYHSYTKLFIKELNRIGVSGIMNRRIQIEPQNFHPVCSFYFDKTYEPIPSIKPEYDRDIIDFHISGAYSAYNWELFFHTPLYIACKLSQDQKYEEAMRWFHFIFDPTDKSDKESPQKFWITRPFFEMSKEENREQDIRKILENITEHAAAVQAWLDNPFKPFLVARQRIVAFQKTVVMKYIDNLIGWGDQLFRQDSMESNNMATLLYVLAYEILGKRPIIIPADESKLNHESNYDEISKKSPYNFLMNYDDSMRYEYTANTAINTIAAPQIVTDGRFAAVSAYTYPVGFSQLEASIVRNRPAAPVSQEDFVRLRVQQREVNIPYQREAVNKELPRIDATNFCVPFNQDLYRYWDIVEDRLFKLRNCMNIEGIVRELPLFEPPIDPAMLVKAAAAGLSLGDILNDMNAPQPYYRFRSIMQKAIEFTGEVKQLGEKLLSALEKKDAEILNMLRSNQEINLQEAMKQVRNLQISEAEENIESILRSIATTEKRREYYLTRQPMNSTELASYALSNKANVLSKSAGIMKGIAGGLVAIPEFSAGAAGFGGSPSVNALIVGGQKLAGALNYAADVTSIKAQEADRSASLLSTKAGYERRFDDWRFQAQQATMEIEQLTVQLTAAEIRLMIAEKELEILEMQIEQSKAVKEYYQDKYTNEALYNWMITQISKTYFQAYQLAYDMAKKAENCYRTELGIFETTNFIQFGYWDSLRRGLLSGDKLIHDLHRLDAAYLDNNKRTLELTKHISMAQMFPKELLDLITNKSTPLKLEEWLFDMDYPGHYKRRIKSVSVTIPNVAGPYTTVSFMLTLSSAKIRRDSLGEYIESPINNDNRFVYQTGGSISQSICTSSAQNDGGVFELNFGDERYLPFENAGAISEWELRFPAAVNQFDLSSVSDVILHINYTALHDGVLEGKAIGALEGKLSRAGSILFSPKQDFPDAWNQMEQQLPRSMEFDIRTEHLSFFMRGWNRESIKTINIGVLFTVKKERTNYTHAKLSLVPNLNTIVLSLLPNANGNNMTIRQDNGNVLIFGGKISSPNLNTLRTWKLELGNISPSDIEDVVIEFSLIKN